MNWRTNTIYCELDVNAITGDTNWLYFHSPDGEGRIYHDTLDIAKEETGISSVVHLI